MRNTILTEFKLSLIGLLVSAGLVSLQAQTEIPASLAQPPGSVNTNAPGFKARVHQMSVARPGPDQNRIALAEQQLAGGFIDPNTGQLYPNEADLTLAGLDGFFVITNVINWNQEIGPIGTGVEIGLFQSTSTPPAPDQGIPGIPGVNSSTENIAVEVLTFLQLKAGTNQFGVSSDDGFKVSIGADARDAFSTIVGFFDAARGVAETLFSFVVAADGIYSVRLLWFEGTGGANVEWYSVDSATGQSILINDRSNPNAIKAYREGSVSSRPYVRSADPAPDAINVTNAPTLNIVIVDGTTASAQIQTNSIQLLFNNQQVTPTITKPAGTNLTTVSYKPPGVLGPESRNSVRLIYGDNATPQILVTNDYSFLVQPITVGLFAINGTNVWRYNRSGLDLGTAWREKVYDDSTWEQGPGPIGDNGDASEIVPIQTAISRFNDDGTHITTLYVRGHFNFPGTNTAGVRLLLTDMVDDGGVFYLNGVEVRRFGIGAGVAFDFSTFFAGHESDAFDGPIEVSSASLVPGDNVFAAEVHQSDGGSSDIVFGAELSAITSNPQKTAIATTVPATNAVDVALNTNIEFTLVDGTQQVVPGSVQLFVNDQAVTPTVTKPTGSPQTKVIYDPPTDFPNDSTVSVRLIYSDNAAPSNVTTNNFSFQTIPNLAVIFAISSTNQLWSYENTGQDLGTAWKEKNFNDSAWPKGPALLALEDGQTSGEVILTPLLRQDPNGVGIITDYFRTHFNFTGDLATARLRIRHVVDDGFVLYLNGNEIYRFGLPAGVTFTSATLFGGHENAYEGPFEVPTPGLVQGDNVLAAEVHQSDATSSDVVFGLELAAIVSSVTAQTPKITSVTRVSGNITIQWSDGGTLESAPSVTGASWTSTGNSSGSFTEPITGPAKFYRVRR